MFRRSRLSCLGCPDTVSCHPVSAAPSLFKLTAVLPVLSRLTCPDLAQLSLECPVPAVLSWPLLPANLLHLVMSVLPRLSYLSCPVHAVMFWLSCSLFPVPAVLLLSFSPTVLPWLSGPSYPVLAFKFRLSCLPVLSFLSFSDHPVLSILSQIGSPTECQKTECRMTEHRMTERRKTQH